MPEIVHGIPLPFFDRLAAELPGDGMGVILDSVEGMQASIRRDLRRLLNTRSSTGYECYLLGNLSVVDFGIPDLSALSVRNGEDRKQLQSVIELAIQTFEPRLKNIHVSVHQSMPGNSRLSVSISADACLHSEQRRLEFQLGLDDASLREEEA